MAAQGEIIDGKYVFEAIEYKTSKGVNSWEIFVELLKNGNPCPITEALISSKLDDSYSASISVNSGKVGGKIRDTVPTIVKEGKNKGRSNETTCLTQAIKEAASKHAKHRKNKQLTAEADEIDYTPPPMLLETEHNTAATVLTDDDFKRGLSVQPKLNGIRCIATMIDGKVLLYSRKCEDFPGSPAIIADLGKLLRPGIYLDGELYKHGASLQYISGQARKTDNNGDLHFHAFDTFTLESAGTMPYAERKKVLSAILKTAMATIHHVPVFRIFSRDELKALVSKFINDGYEGAVVRRDSGIYKFGYNSSRSPDALKFKLTFSAEFPVIGFTEGKGQSEGAIIWICETASKNTFTVVPKNMTLAERKKIYAEVSKPGVFDKLIRGCLLTVDYQEMSELGTPMRMNSVIMRTYESGPAADPIHILLNL